MRITIPDDLYDRICLGMPTQTAEAVEAEIARRLALLADGRPGEAALVLSHQDLLDLGFDCGRDLPPTTLAELRRYIQRLGSVELGEIRLGLNVFQLEEIRRLAERNGMPPQEYLLRVTKRFLDEIFRTPPAAGTWPELQPARDADLVHG